MEKVNPVIIQEVNKYYDSSGVYPKSCDFCENKNFSKQVKYRITCIVCKECSYTCSPCYLQQSEKQFIKKHIESDHKNGFSIDIK